MIYNEPDEKTIEIFILMILGKMTLTEINTLTDKERYFLSKWFKDKSEQERASYEEGVKGILE